MANEPNQKPCSIVGIQSLLSPNEDLVGEKIVLVRASECLNGTSVVSTFMMRLHATDDRPRVLQQIPDALAVPIFVSMSRLALSSRARPSRAAGP